MDGLIDVTFGDSAAEEFLNRLENGQTVSAAALLAVLDTQSEDAVAQIMQQLGQREIMPDLADLPKYSADGETAVRLRREAQIAKQGNFMDALEPTDPLYLYLQEIAGIPVSGDVEMLAKQLAQSPDTEDICTALMNLSLSRVVELACTYAGHGVLLLDLIQEGSIGLWEALTHYEGGNFTQFRDRWICWYMAKAVILQTHASGVGQRLRQTVEDYRSVDEKLLAELGRNPTLEEIAEGLHVSVQEAAVAAKALENARTLHRVKKPEPDQLPQEEDQAVEDTAYFQMRQRIMELLSGLSPEDTQLLTLRYGLEGGMPMDPQQVGKQLGLTPEEVIAKETAVLAKLRQQN